LLESSQAVLLGFGQAVEQVLLALFLGFDLLAARLHHESPSENKDGEQDESDRGLFVHVEK
jgi:hypothetical protein